MRKLGPLVGEVFGGAAAMLVALPSAIAFGILVYAPLGGQLAAAGALAGILGTVAMGCIAPLLGGAPRLVSAPCAPAAAVLGALTLELTKNGQTPVEAIPLILTSVALFSGMLQFLFGWAGGGRLIKYIPYPVVAGYLSGVGILIIIGQIPKFLAIPKGVATVEGILSPSLWNVSAVIVGAVAIGIMWGAPKLTKAVPAPILALTGAITTYFGLSLIYPELQQFSPNALIIGPITQEGGPSFLATLGERWKGMGSLAFSALKAATGPALTLAVLLSIDTLKTCVVVDALTRSRHNSNRELIGQGVANITSALIGGIPGAGTMGATLVNINSGGTQRLSAFLEGVFALLAFLVLGRFVAWVPVSALAGILLVVGFRMVDRQSFRLLRQRSTVLDFCVILAVVVTAVATNLIAAAGVGLAMAIILFLRDQIRGSVVRRRLLGNQMFSKKRRLPVEIGVLESKGNQTVIFELQGALFFGTTDQLFNEVEPYLAHSKYVILDMRRVTSVDFTAAHLLEQIEAQVAEREGLLIFSDLPASLPTGQDLQRYFKQMGLVRASSKVRIFPDLDSALEWTEEEILAAQPFLRSGSDEPLELKDFEMVAELTAEERKAVTSIIDERIIPKGQKVFSQGQEGDEMYLIRQGSVRIELPLAGGKRHHLATFSKGDFFGDMSFLDLRARSADAVAVHPLHLFAISRKKFDEITQIHPILTGKVLSRLALTLAIRLRQTDTELRALEEA